VILSILPTSILAALLVSASPVISDWSVSRSPGLLLYLTSYLSVSRSSGLCFSALLLTCLQFSASVLRCILLTGLSAALLVSASPVTSDWSVSRSPGFCFSALLLTCLLAVPLVSASLRFFSLVY
jgi:hypothetical protein